MNRNSKREEITNALLNKISRAKANELEAAVKSNPNDLSARTKLLGFYCQKAIWNEQDFQSHCKHILWLVENMPAEPVLYDPIAFGHYLPKHPELFQKASELWESQIAKHPENALILANAAAHYLQFKRNRAIELFEECLLLEPENRDWKGRVAFACELGSRLPEDADKLARALQLREDLASDNSNKEWRKLAELVDLAQTAYKANHFEKASIAANEAISIYSNPVKKNTMHYRGSWMHEAYSIAGLTAANKGDLETAKQHLFNSVSPEKCGEGPSYRSPDMDLALELIRLGESKAVSKFLLESSRTMTDDRAQMLLWWLQLRCFGKSSLDKIGTIELFMPGWLDRPAAFILKMIRKIAKVDSVCKK